MKKFILISLATIAATLAFGQNYKIIGINANDIIYVPSEDKLYISTPGVGSNGNSLCIIDPHLGTVEECFFVGSEPGELAMSDDEHFIYIGLSGTPQVVKFNLVTKSIDLTFPLGGDPFFGPFYAEEIKVLPGQPNSIAVSRMVPGISPRHQGVGIYDDGVQRPNTTQTHTGSNSISFANAADILYGYNNETSEFGLRSIDIDSDGAQEGNVVTGLINGFGPVIESQGNIIYSSNGSAINVANSAPILAGTYDLQQAFNPAVEPAPDSNVVYFVTSGFSDDYSLKTFQKNSFIMLDEQPLNNVSGYLGKLINWGGQGKLAFNTSEMVVIFENCNSLITAPLSVEPAVAGGCWGDFVVLTAAAGYDNYLWSNGAVGQNISVTEPGEYYYSVADPVGCYSQPSTAANVYFGYEPPTPYIQANGNLLASSAQGNNQWFLNGNAIPGATGQFLNPTEAGFYSVQAIDNGCASGMSDLYNFNPTSVGEAPVEKLVLVYPLPTKKTLNIASVVDIRAARVYDLLGKEWDVLFERGQINLEEMPDGVYILQVFDQNNTIVATQKIVKAG